MTRTFAIEFEPVAGELRRLGFADTLNGARECAREAALEVEERGRVLVRRGDRPPGRGVAFRVEVDGLPPDVVRVGRWAHVRWVKRQHLVAAHDPADRGARPVRMACGERFERFRIWHDPELPHLPRCARCVRAAA